MVMTLFTILIVTMVDYVFFFFIRAFVTVEMNSKRLVHKFALVLVVLSLRATFIHAPLLNYYLKYKGFFFKTKFLGTILKIICYLNNRDCDKLHKLFTSWALPDFEYFPFWSYQGLCYYAYSHS